jgi:hypothetical protein
MRIDNPSVSGSITFIGGNNTISADAVSLTGSLSGSFAGEFSGEAQTAISGAASIDTSSLATTGSNTFIGNQTHSGSILPAVNDTYDLGSTNYQWRDLFLSSGSLYIDGTQIISSDANTLTFTTDAGQSIKILETGGDDITFQTDTGNIEMKGTVEVQSGKKIIDSAGTVIQFGDTLGVTGSIEVSGTVDGIDLQEMSSSLSASIAGVSTDFDDLTNKPTLLSGSAQIATDVSGSFTSTSSSLASELLKNTTDTLTGDLTVTGTLTAQEFHTEFVSASILFDSGSTKFGDSSDDIHNFTGSLKTSGLITAPTLSIQNQINTTSSNLEINYANGDGTTTDFKDFYVRDGKNAVILNIQGSSKNSTFFGTITAGNGNQAINADADLTLRNVDLGFVGVDFKSNRTSGNIGGLRYYGTASDSVPVAQFLVETDGQLKYYNGTNGAETRLTLDSSGKVGIGTTSPGSTLELYGNTSSGGYGGYPALTLRNDNASGFSVIHFNQSTAQKARVEVSNSVGSMGLYTGSTANGITILANGKVGIGTDDPVQPLHVNGQVLFRTTTVDGGKNRFQLIPGGSSDAANLYLYYGNTGDGTLSVRINAQGDSYFNGGNVGIGTTSPFNSAKLQVRTDTDRNVAIQTGTTHTTGIKINAFNDAANTNVPLELNGSLLSLKTGETEKMRIASNGAIGIGGANYGSSGQVLTSNGNAAPSWQAVSAGVWATKSITLSQAPTTAYTLCSTVNASTISAGMTGLIKITIFNANNLEVKYYNVYEYNGTSGGNGSMWVIGTQLNPPHAESPNNDFEIQYTGNTTNTITFKAVETSGAPSYPDSSSNTVYWNAHMLIEAFPASMWSL